MKKLDKLLLGCFQAVADWCQEWFGADNFFLAKFSCAVIWFFALVETAARMSNPKNLGASSFDLFLEFGITLILLPWVLIGERSCKNSPTFRNPNEVSLRPMRYMWICGVVAIAIIEVAGIFGVLPHLTWSPFPQTFEIPHNQKELANWTTLFRFLGWVVFMFFGSCTPKPPVESRLARLFTRLAHAT